MLSPSRIAAKFLRLAAEYKNLSEESKAVVLGALVFDLRKEVNSRSQFYFNGRPKDVKFRVVDGRIEVKDFPVPEVARIEYDPEQRVVKVLSRGGVVLAKAPFTARLDYTTVSLKAFGKAMSLPIRILLSGIRKEEDARTERYKTQEEPPRQEERTPPQTRRSPEDFAKEQAAKADAERKRKYLETHISSQQLSDALSHVGIKAKIRGFEYERNMIVGEEGLNLYWNTTDNSSHFFWILRHPYTGERLPDGEGSYSGRVPMTEVEKGAKAIAAEVKDTLKKIEVGAAKKKKEEEAKVLQETQGVWSVARTNDMIAETNRGGDDEDDDGERNGYIGEVETFNSKEKALAYARDIAPCYVVKGTQMWNEPIGQVEEHDKVAWYQFVQGDRRYR